MTGINYQNNNSYNAYPQLRHDIQQVRHAVEKVDTVDNSVATMAMGSITPLRRVSSLPEKFRNDEIVAGLTLTGLAAINLPEDLRDLKGAVRQVNDKVLSKNAKAYVAKNHKDFYENFVKYDPIYDRSKYQHSFSFFRGTMLERFVDPTKVKNTKMANKILAADSTVLNTKFGKFIQKTLGVEYDEVIYTKIKDVGYTKENNAFVEAASFKGGSKFGRITCKAMMRVPLLAVGALALVELPKIFKSTDKGDNFFSTSGEVAKQTVKSGVNVASILAGIGYSGAIGHKYLGPVGSLIGMGVGAVIGATGSRKLQEVIG